MCLPYATYLLACLRGVEPRDRAVSQVGPALGTQRVSWLAGEPKIARLAHGVTWEWWLESVILSDSTETSTTYRT